MKILPDDTSIDCAETDNYLYSVKKTAARYNGMEIERTVAFKGQFNSSIDKGAK